MIEANKKIVMCGNHIGGREIIESLIKDGIKFNYFVCLSPEQATKYNVQGYFDYKPLAQKHNIPYYIPERFDLKSETDLSFFNNNSFDLLIQGGWQRLFPDSILSSLTYGALGFHGSSDFLPKGRGRSPLNWSLVEGKKRFIMHLFLMKQGVDDGDIIDFEDFDINEWDDIETLYYKYSMINTRLLLKNVNRILEGNTEGVKQQGVPSYYSKRNENDALIDWENMDVYQIYNLIRGVSKPYHGAVAIIESKKYRIWKARPFDTRLKYINKAYGEIVQSFDKKLILNARGGLLLLDEYKIEL
jgi:methionyl-tRNA formyltransferase